MMRAIKSAGTALGVVGAVLVFVVWLWSIYWAAALVGIWP